METVELDTTVLDMEAVLPIDGQGDQLELNLGLPDSQRRLINALGVTARIRAGERVCLDEVHSRTHGAETVVLVGRALRGRLTEI